MKKITFTLDGCLHTVTAYQKDETTGYLTIKKESLKKNKVELHRVYKVITYPNHAYWIQKDKLKCARGAEGFINFMATYNQSDVLQLNEMMKIIETIIFKTKEEVRYI